ncbi:MAG: hypothetical protein QY326_03935 [Bdellovibrionota bacterium]|nr:MAG: hypothetical protein QY326_03935 [Bdellovibrionota bacterium]
MRLREALRAPLRAAAQRPSLLVLPGAIALACAELRKLPSEEVIAAMHKMLDAPALATLRVALHEAWPFLSIGIAILLLSYAAAYAVATLESESRAPGLARTLVVTVARAPAVIIVSILALLLLLLLLAPGVTVVALLYFDIPRGIDKLPLSFAAGAVFALIVLASFAPLARLFVAYLVALTQRTSIFSALYLARLLTRKRLAGLLALLAISLFAYGSIALGLLVVSSLELKEITMDSVLALSLFALALGLWHFVGASSALVLAWYNTLSHEHMRTLTEAFRLEPPVSALKVAQERRRPRRPRFTSALTQEEIRTLLLHAE